jgi:hypothetical protein
MNTAVFEPALEKPWEDLRSPLAVTALDCAGDFISQI